MKIVFVYSDCEALGIEYLSAALKIKGHETSLAFDPKLFDTELVSLYPLDALLSYKNTLINKIKKANPDLICFSICSDNFQWALNLSRLIKKALSVPVVFGGIHPTIIPDIVIKYPSIDYVCVGEGDEAIVELADALEAGKDIRYIPNLWVKQDGEIYSNPPRPLIDDLDTLPFPDKEIFANVYPQFIQGYKIATSRGCPYLCTYCANHQIKDLYKDTGKSIRRRSVQNVISELKLAKEKYKIQMVRFFDDVFTYDKNWLKEFSDRYKKEIDLPYFCFVYPNNCDAEIIQLLQESGCKTAFMGFGTFSETSRSKVLGRHYTNDTVAHLINSFKKSSVYLIVDFILGLPMQTPEEIINMAHFFNQNRPDVLSGLFLRYYPKTAITYFAKKEGLLNDNQIMQFNESNFNERIIIDKERYNWLKKIQTLMIFSKYLPQSLVKWLLEKKIYNSFLPWDLNNFSVIFDSVIPKGGAKRRIHTDAISPLQYMHFYAYFMLSKWKNDVWETLSFLKNHISHQIKKTILIYKLGLRRMNFRKLSSTLRYLFRTKILRKYCPGAVIIGLTYRCQCNCVHCSVGSYPSNLHDEMDVARLKELMDEIVEYGIPKVNFFGGEPLIRNEEIIDLVHYGYHKGLSVSIDTNGIMLTEDLVGGLKKSGINNINISIDSADSKIHDQLRKFPGAFEKATEALKLCVRERIPCVLSTYASKRGISSGDLKKIVALGKDIGVTAVKILLPLMAGNWQESQCELLSPLERRKVYDLLDPGFVYLESPLFSQKNGKKICEALNRNMLYISPYGDIQMCYATPFSFGNIRNESLKSIINRMWTSNFFNSIENDYDCVMNNPIFRAKISKIDHKSHVFPIDYKKI